MAKLYTSPPKFSQLPTYIRQDVPVYRLREDIYTDDTLFPKGSTIEADEDYEPSLAMFPVNEMALGIYRSLLKKLDGKGRDYDKLNMDQRRGYLQWIPKLPEFEKEWEKVNDLAKTRGLHICQAIDKSPSILGAPRTGKPRVRSVDMNNIPLLSMEDVPVVQGNKASIVESSVTDVQAVV